MANQIDTDAQVQAEKDVGFGQQHIIRKSNDGVLYAVQINDSSEIEVHTSNTDGIYWSLDTTFSFLNNPQNLSLAKSELDDIFLCFNNGSNNIIVKKKDASSGIWNEILDEYQSTNFSQIPQGLITYNKIMNRLHLVWVTNHSDGIICERHTDDKGISWSTKVGYTPDSGSQYIALYGLDSHPSTGSLYVHYFYKGWSNYRTEILNSDGVRTGSECKLVSATEHLGGGLAIASVGDRWKIAYWKVSGDYKLTVIKNNEYMTPSLEIDYSTTDALKRGMVSIGIDGADNVYIFYVKESDGKCYYRMYIASTETWGSETVLTTGDGLRPSCEQHSLLLSDKLHTVFYTA